MKKYFLLILAFVPALAFAQGFQVNLGGQKQIGMGHTGVGLLQDGASVSFNPGAVALQKENYIQGGVSPLFLRTEFNPTGSDQKYYNKNLIAPPFTFYATWGAQAAWWKLGVGVYTPFGGLYDWGNEWTGRYSLEKLKLEAIYIQPTLSIKLSDHIGIGGGFIYNYGTVDLRRALPVSDANGQIGQAELKGTGHGYGWNAGIFIKTQSGISIGVSHRSKVKTTIEDGDAVFTVPASLQANFPQPNTFSSSLPLPSTTSLGFGFYPSPKWTLALDVNYSHWRVYKALAFDYGNNTPALQDTYSPRNYGDAGSVRGGAQFSPSDKISWRLGAGYVGTPVKSGYVTPEAPDAERVYGTAGLGFKPGKHFDLDLAFQYERVLKRTQTNIESQLAGSFTTNVFIPGISLSYHW